MTHPHPRARLAGALLLAATFTSAGAHGRVESSSPSPGSTVHPPPSEIRLRFNEPVESAFTAVTLVGPSGQAVATPAKARVEDGKTVVLPLAPLAPGAYTAQWKSVGQDGHPIHGELAFTVK